MPPIPFYLILLTIAFVILPSIAASLLRFTLYKRLIFF